MYVWLSVWQDCGAGWGGGGATRITANAVRVSQKYSLSIYLLEVYLSMSSLQISRDSQSKHLPCIRAGLKSQIERTANFSHMIITVFLESEVSQCF